MDDLEAHLKDLRTLYINATPRQRLRVAKDRLNHLSSGPNILIQVVSAG